MSSRESLSELHVWNITEQLLQSRVVKIYGEINTEMAHMVTSCLDVLSSDDPSAIIKLEICTPGGSVLDGLAICDKIMEIPNNVIAFNTGLCASMGTAISSVCDYAFAAENTSFMIHEMSTGLEGKFRDIKNTLKYDEQLNNRLMSIIAKKCNKTFDEVMHDAVYDHWMTAEEAKAYGLVDAITPHATKDSAELTQFLNKIGG